MRNQLRLNKNAAYKIIADELTMSRQQLTELNKNLRTLSAELSIIEKNTEGLNYILLENQKRDSDKEDQENSRG